MKSTQAGSFRLLFVAFLAGAVSSTYFLFHSDPWRTTVHLGWLAAAGIAVVAATMAGVLTVARLSLGQASRRRLIAAIFLAASGFLSLAMLEAGFMQFSRSHGVGYSLAAQAWFRRYWHVNSLGYREIEFSAANLADRKKLVIVGDSFTAGHGIAKPEDRFSDRLQLGLTKDWLVLNCGINGADSRTEFKYLESLPFRPDFLILAYFGNDIREAADAARHSPAVIVPYADVSPAVAQLVQKSFLLDFLYWSVPQKDLQHWWDYYDEVYRDPRILAMHEEDLAKFCRYAEQQEIPFLVVLFPYLQDLPRSDTYVHFVRNYFEKRAIPVLDVREFVGDLTVRERTVNVNDIHPSRLVHQRVSDHLTPMVRSIIEARRKREH